MKYKTILFIDDDEDDHLIFQDALSHFKDKPTFLFYYSAIEALTDLKSGSISPDLILLDVNMPKMTGLQFLVIIKRDEDLMSIPVIVNSTSDNVKTKQICLELGAMDYLVKPTNYDQLLNVIKDLFLGKGE